MKIKRHEKEIFTFIEQQFSHFIHENHNINYEVYTTSCYISNGGLKKFLRKIDKILAEDKKITIYVDKKGFKNIDNLNEIEKIVKEHTALSIRIPKPKGNKLFHPKAYAVIAKEQRKGIIVFGSANLSDAGLGEYGNTEIIASTSDEQYIQDFIDWIEELDKSYENLESVREFYENPPKLALIKKGCIFKSAERSTIEKLLMTKYTFEAKVNIGDENDERYHFYDEEKYNEKHKIGKEDGEEKQSDKISFVNSQEYQYLQDCYLRYDPGHLIRWGEFGITIGNQIYWLPDNMIIYLKNEDLGFDDMCNEFRQLLSGGLRETAKKSMQAYLSTRLQEERGEDKAKYKLIDKLKNISYSNFTIHE